MPARERPENIGRRLRHPRNPQRQAYVAAGTRSLGSQSLAPCVPHTGTVVAKATRGVPPHPLRPHALRPPKGAGQANSPASGAPAAKNPHREPAVRDLLSDREEEGRLTRLTASQPCNLTVLSLAVLLTLSTPIATPMVITVLRVGGPRVGVPRTGSTSGNLLFLRQSPCENEPKPVFWEAFRPFAELLMSAKQ